MLHLNIPIPLVKSSNDLSYPMAEDPFCKLGFISSEIGNAQDLYFYINI